MFKLPKIRTGAIGRPVKKVAKGVQATIEKPVRKTPVSTVARVSRADAMKAKVRQPRKLR